jgi:hypothetical protein
MGFTAARPEQNMKASRLAMSLQLLEILQHCQATDFVNFLTGDELWLFLEHPHYVFWAASRDEVLETPMTRIGTEKCMISIIWFISRIRSPVALTKEMKRNSQYFSRHLFPDIQQSFCSSSGRKRLKDMRFHLDNVLSPNSWLSSETIECANPQRAPDPPSNPDQAQHQVTSSSLVI